MCVLSSIFSIRKTFNAYDETWNVFSLAMSCQSTWEFMFLNKTPTNNFPFANFPLVQFLLIVFSVKVTHISNGTLASVAYSQGRASADSRAHLVIESGPLINELLRILDTYKYIFSVFDELRARTYSRFGIFWTLAPWLYFFFIILNRCKQSFH